MGKNNQNYNRNNKNKSHHGSNKKFGKGPSKWNNVVPDKKFSPRSE